EYSERSDRAGAQPGGHPHRARPHQLDGPERDRYATSGAARGQPCGAGARDPREPDLPGARTHPASGGRRSAHPYRARRGVRLRDDPRALAITRSPADTLPMMARLLAGRILLRAGNTSDRYANLLV